MFSVEGMIENYELKHVDFIKSLKSLKKLGFAILLSLINELKSHQFL